MRTRRLADEAEDTIDDVVSCIAIPSRSHFAPPVKRRKRSKIRKAPEEPVEIVQPEKKEREYRRGNQHQTWTLHDMEMAVRVVEGREMSQHAAAKYYEVPKSTPNDRIKGKVKLDAKPGPEVATQLSQPMTRTSLSCGCKFVRRLAIQEGPYISEIRHAS